jgi:hypothetical protein
VLIFKVTQLEVNVLKGGRNLNSFRQTFQMIPFVQVTVLHDQSLDGFGLDESITEAVVGIGSHHYSYYLQDLEAIGFLHVNLHLSPHSHVVLRIEAQLLLPEYLQLLFTWHEELLFPVNQSMVDFI